ncbi:hypothetical protein [Aurantiacibacter spongiae]|uniref:Argininosuccinate lyase n=1 Tax=Aurantiacibacter spongiae TaxID=2488860 RepID=A0A3N5DP28_9SPHN|nr:hypothetical protein [Aurantiacibacter spongiae]RPF70851.1 hypothetical protein EG799_03850 [Aurantiacibacter spongiae]
MTKAIAALGLALVLTGCAQEAELVPAPGETLPPPPYGAADPLTAEDLLELDPLAAPERNVELRRESEEREEDPFDLPPPK